MGKKYTELQTRKLISSYGGVGSILETIDGALKVREFDKWQYFAMIERGREELTENQIIEDDRLLKRLKYYFQNLNFIAKVPANYSEFYNASIPSLRNHIVNAEYFPKWMYCNKCGRFKRIDDWFKGWCNVYSNDVNRNRESFQPPVCYKCYSKAKDNKEKRKFFRLEQVRFIMTAPNGDIDDLPWHLWTNRADKSSNEKKDEGESAKFFNDFNPCCKKQDLYYLKSDKFSDFSGVRIQCKNPDCKTKGRQFSLAGLLGLIYPHFTNGEISTVKDKEGNEILSKEGKSQKIFYKPVIRSSNSVYYPLITNSLFIPTRSISSELKSVIKTLHRNINLTPEQIRTNILENNQVDLTLGQIKEIISPEQNDFVSETEYRLREYDYLLSENHENDQNLVVESVISDSLKSFKINKLLKLKRLKLSSVQTGYSRQEPIDKDLYAELSMDDYVRPEKGIKAKYTSTKGNGTTILPGVESFGEGIFIDFDKESIIDWYESVKDKSEFKKRMDSMLENMGRSDYRMNDEKNKMLGNLQYLSKFILIHTFSHILIKELEFLTGYPATSMQERLYTNEKEMQGVLIYTIAGTEGSYGGLVRQAEPERFVKILNSAITRAKDCASDPICYHSDGQGIGGLNLAACYSCSLLPETSCEEFNSYLDRAVLVDKKFGYYNEI
ncbi:DrmB family protein [Ulvibacterium sp.]|uniref:DrmB family protein n=1 Tax=Ulvibacterium sp. TaxID=2665914 RepID=UPI003BAC1C9B